MCTHSSLEVNKTAFECCKSSTLLVQDIVDEATDLESIE
jgi:hypothetical protein